MKNIPSVSEKELSKQNSVEKFEMREQNKNKTEAKWKYKVSCFQLRAVILLIPPPVCSEFREARS